MQTTRSHVILAALLVLATGACKHDEKKAGGGSASQAAAPASDEVRGMLALIPKASDEVVGVDLGKLRASELFQSYQKDIEDAVGSQLDMIRKLCNLDPLQLATKVVAGGAGNRSTGDLTLVAHGVSRQSTMDCLQKVAAKPPEGVTVTIDGAYVRIEKADVASAKVVGADAGVPLVAGSGSGTGTGTGSGSVIPVIPKQAIALEFLDDQTLVVAGRSGAAADKKMMDDILHLAPAASVTGSPGFMEMIDAVDTEAPAWFVVNGKSETVQKLGRGMLAFDAAFGHLYAAAGLDVAVTLRLGDPDAATRTSDLANRQLQSMKKSMMKDMIGDATVEHDGRDVRFHVQESKDQLAKLVDFARTVLGSLLGD